MTETKNFPIKGSCPYCFGEVRSYDDIFICNECGKTCRDEYMEGFWDGWKREKAERRVNNEI